MALNPVVFTEKVVRSFLRYQLTAYPFADERLHAQMRTLLSLDKTRHSPLLKGPFVSLSRPFRQGAAVADLVKEGIFHPHMRQLIPRAITHLYSHQEEAIRAIHAGKTTLVSTGTGSGKTECFIYPIVSRCLELRDAGEAAGISAVIVYPMNALAEDQLGRLRSLLAGTGIPFGMYVGKTPDFERDVAGYRMPKGSTAADYEAKLDHTRKEKRGETIYPAEEVCSREMMRKPGGQPRILLTNIKQLELLLTRHKDVELFHNARLDFLVFDEAHTFTGAQGAETACLIRRLRAFCRKNARDTVCIATSATIVDRENPDAARQFASRFFGVPAGTVATVGEAYEREVWNGKRTIPSAPKKDPAQVLAACVTAVETVDDDGKAVRAAYKDLAGKALPDGAWPEVLFEALSKNDLVYHLNETLARPRALDELPEELEKSVGRPVSEPEILAWLTLGAAARNEGRPLLRPVVHGFIRGISGAVVTFPEDQEGPKLRLAAADEEVADDGETKHAHFPITTCTTCGQHYFCTFLKDFEFTKRHPEGGEAVDGGRFWPRLDEASGGRRVILIDRVVGGSDDETLEERDRTAPVFVCRHCGAVHIERFGICLGCGTPGKPVELHALRQNENSKGNLSSCISCGATGRRIGTRYREPARPVRATNVADVHVLAQDMVQHSERKRLLVFCDNRQDAAFQAGWMKDHARRFRLRALMAEGLKEGAVSIGDLAMRMDEALGKDDALSRALVPEVWQVARREGSGGRHEKERQKFLRFQVLREVTQSARQPIGLEPWGRLKVSYQGLDASLPWIQTQARRLKIEPEKMCMGVESVLDYLRRKKILHDPVHEIFTRYWQEGDPEIQQGYLPLGGNPVGTKLRRDSADKTALVCQWQCIQGDTTLRQIVKKWGVDGEGIDPFLEEMFGFLVERGILKPVTLKGPKGRALPNVSGVYQIDADGLRLAENHQGVYRCDTCRRRTTRETPNMKCPAWRCDGTISDLPNDEDDYNLQLLDQGYSMLRPEEHTAMVPHDERERLENLFKGESEAVNCFVCTPTLELGVDIGRLDAVLMRNVPPLPANYWQRAGRAGRRHRMAVNLTYCRPVSHDRSYFTDPLKLLSGRVDPPAFNLSNELMVGKHVHAAVITRLHQCATESSRPEREREETARILDEMLPNQVSGYLFEEGQLRTAPFDFSPLKDLIGRNLEDLVGYVERVFRDGWPKEDAEVVEAAALRGYVAEMVDRLEEVVGRLRRRLRWAMDQISRLNRVRERQGALDAEDDALFKRCDKLVKKLKGTAPRTRHEAEGYDDTNTFGVLAAEGFLPGYGLEVGSILGTAEIPFWRMGALEFALPRPPSVALREYVPGNLIYANGNKFVARRFHRDVDEQRIEMPCFEVSTDRQAVKETAPAATQSALGATVLPTISVCDVDLVHQSHISDEEELRFQMAVTVYGIERDQHNGGRAFDWGGQALHHRRGVRFRLVNVGATNVIDKKNGKLGYPVCTVCGQSVSPMVSARQLQLFQDTHKERCGRPVEPVGFYADVVADALSLPGLPDQKTAYSVTEAIRFAATRVLDMHLDDLQILVINHVDRDEADAILWDTMPGGSGLLDQICARFTEIAKVAVEIVSSCPASCASACVDCLQTFRNGFYHKHLDRSVALEKFEAWGETLRHTHDIPPRQPAQKPGGVGTPVNLAEQKLKHLLLNAGFEEGDRGKQLKLDQSLGTTTPDVYYMIPDQEEGVCIYLDGMSEHLHGNPETAERDRRIRAWLRNNGYEVIEIAVNELDDVAAMRLRFRKLAAALRNDKIREAIKSGDAWFSASAPSPAPRFSLKILRSPEPRKRYATCVPLVPLKAAAGAFSDPQSVDESEFTEWVELDTRRPLKPGMFVAQVVGRSMEPKIPDGAYCLFSAPVTGTRQGRIVLVQLRDSADPDTGERYTVKTYASEKTAADTDSPWRHVKVILKPINREFQPIILTCDDEGTVQVVAEMVEVLGR